MRVAPLKLFIVGVLEVSSRIPSQVKSKSYDPELRGLAIKLPTNPIVFGPPELPAFEPAIFEEV